MCHYFHCMLLLTGECKAENWVQGLKNLSELQSGLWEQQLPGKKKKKKTKKSALAFLKNTKKKSFIFAILTSYSSLKFVLKKQTYYEFRWTGRRISFPCEGLKLNWASYDAWGPQVLYFSHAGCKQHFFYL